MDIKYHKLFQVVVRNTYFPGDVCSVVDIIPTRFTAEVMKNYEILLRKEKNVFTFYQGLPGIDKTLPFEISGVNDLTFQVVSNDPHYFNYTDLPFKTKGKLLYFSTDNVSGTDDKLTNDSHASIIDEREIEPNPVQLQLPKGKAKIEIKYLSGVAVYTAEVEPKKPIDYSVNIHSLPTGEFELSLNGNLQRTFLMFLKPSHRAAWVCSISTLRSG